MTDHVKFLAALRSVPVIRISGLNDSLVPVVKIKTIAALGFTKELPKNEPLGMLGNNLLSRAKKVKIPMTYRLLTEKNDSESGDGQYRSIGNAKIAVNQSNNNLNNNENPPEIKDERQMEGIGVKSDEHNLTVSDQTSLATDIKTAIKSEPVVEDHGVKYQSVSVKKITPNPAKKKKKKKNKNKNK